MVSLIGRRIRSINSSRFSGNEVLFDNDKVIGVGTGDMGIAKDGTIKDNY